VIPIDLVWYDEGVFVRAAPAALARILGGQVVEIGSVPMDEALRRIDAIVSRDNEWGARWMSMEYLRTPDALQALGLADRPDAAVLTVKGTDGARETVTLAAESVTALESLMLAPAPIEGSPAPASRGSAPYRFEVLQGQQLVWVEIDEMRNGNGESLADFTTRLMRAIDEDGIESMAIDLRRNHGGSGSLTQPLLRAIIGSPRVNRPDHLFVLISRETFSAAMAFAAELDQYTAALFVGEPTGSRPNFVGESSIFTLPYSQTIVSCSSLYHQNGHPTDTRLWIAPDLPVPRNQAELRTSEDLGRSTILRRIAALR
jgi:C-terminal processing protease CtpA/Prc